MLDACYSDLVCSLWLADPYRPSLPAGHPGTALGEASMRICVSALAPHAKYEMSLLNRLTGRIRAGVAKYAL